MVQFLILFTIVFLCVRTPLTKPFVSGRHKMSFFIAMMILCVLAALRGTVVGNDTLIYKELYETCRDTADLGPRYEIGYIYFNYFLNKVTNNPQFLFIVSSCFIYFSFGRFIWRYSELPWLSFVFFFLLAFDHTLNILRQCIAIGILFFSFDFIIKRRFIPFAICVVAASLFHTTAILFIVSWFLPLIKIDLKVVSLYIIGAIASYFLFANLLEFAFRYFAMYEYYSGGDYFDGNTRLASIVQVITSSIITIFCLYPYFKHSTLEWRNSEKGKIYKVLCHLQLISFFITVLCLKVNLLDRIALYFSIYSFVLIPNAIFLLPLKKRKVLSFWIILFFLTFNSYVYINKPDWNRIYPYEFFWNNKK